MFSGIPKAGFVNVLSIDLPNLESFLNPTAPSLLLLLAWSRVMGEIDSGRPGEATMQIGLDLRSIFVVSMDRGEQNMSTEVGSNKGLRCCIADRTNSELISL